MAKKIKKAILAGLAAYAGAKMLKSKKAAAALSGVPEGKEMITKKDALVDAISGGTKFPSKKGHPGGWNWEKGFSSPPNPKKFWEFWKKMGGSVHAKSGQMIKASQGTHVKSGRMLKARHGTEVRTMGSNPHVPKGGSVSVATKLNGTLTTKTF